MAKIQEVFQRIKETKEKQKEIRRAYKDALDSSMSYKEVSEELKKLREKKKKIEAEIKSDFNAEFDKLDELKLDLESDNMMLSDIAISQLMKGESIEVTDEYDNEYEPVFSVKFIKAK